MRTTAFTHRTAGRSLLLLLLLMLSLPSAAFAQEPAPVMTGYRDGFLLFEDGEGYILDADGGRTELSVPNGADVRWCRALGDTLWRQDADGSVWRGTDLEKAERLLRKMPPAAGVVCTDETEELIFSDGTVYDARSKETTRLPLESALIGAEANDYMTVLAEENGTLWIRKTDGDFERLRYAKRYGVRVRLTDMTVSENTVYICGERTEDGSPFLAGSVMGGVWTERPLSVPGDDGTAAAPEGIPLCMTAAEESDTLVLGFSGGTLAVLPSCVKCSAFYETSASAVTAAAAAGDALGYIADGAFHVISLDDIPPNDNPDDDCPRGC